MSKSNGGGQSWRFGVGYPHVYTYDFEDKDRLVSDLVSEFQTACQSMVTYDGMPESVPQTEFKRIAQNEGYAALTVPEVIGEPFAFCGGLGGDRNGYYIPINATVSNSYVKGPNIPAGGLSKTLTDGVDCVIIPHDSNFRGLFPTISRYCTLIAENLISIRLALIRCRSDFALTALNDTQKASIEHYLADLERGRLGPILADSFSGPPAALPQNASSQGGGALVSLLESQQYLVSTLWMKLGVSAQWNAKRESLNETESASGDDILTPGLDDIISTQNAAFKRYEALTGIRIRARLSGVWARIKEDSTETAEEKRQGEEQKPDTEPEGGGDGAETD